MSAVKTAIETLYWLYVITSITVTFSLLAIVGILASMNHKMKGATR